MANTCITIKKKKNQGKKMVTVKGDEQDSGSRS